MEYGGERKSRILMNSAAIVRHPLLTADKDDWNAQVADEIVITKQRWYAFPAQRQRRGDNSVN